MMENQWGPLAKRDAGAPRQHATTMIIYVRRRLLKAAKDLANGIEPAEPWHPEIYRMHRESATGATEQEAIDKARELALTDLLEKHEEVAAPAIRV